MRIGIVGFGNMGFSNVRQIDYIEGAEIAAVVEPHLANLAKAREYYAGKKVDFFSDLETGLRDSNVDAWIVASSTNSHVKITNRLLGSGSKVLLEKPLANSFAEAQNLSSYVKKDSSNLMLGHILLWNLEFETLFEEVKKLGKINAINCSRQRSADHRVNYPGESPFTLTMIHDLYTVYKLLDGQVPIKFSAQARDHADGGVDWTQAQILWAENILASFTANFHIPNGTVGGIDEISVYGDGWLVNLIYDSGVVSVTTDKGNHQVKVPPPALKGATNHFEHALRGEIEHFLKVIEGDASVPLGARYEDACEMQKWLDKLISLTQTKGATDVKS